MGRGPGGSGSAFRFTPREIADMERALDITDGATPARRIIQSLADSFSESIDRAGQKEIQWKQVWNWFQNRRHAQKQKIARMPGKGGGNLAKPTTSSIHDRTSATSTSGAVHSAENSKKPGRKSLEGHQMKFEAKSTDGAWYDVSAFVSHKLTDTFDPQVRVRYSGFGPEDDEWVSLNTAVRQRSQACEASDCVVVLPGDLILCFQDGTEQALYFDADILDVQRRRHDVRGCRCRFWVRYRHDESEEVVPLRKVCRRPETDSRLQHITRGGSFPEEAESYPFTRLGQEVQVSLKGGGTLAERGSTACSRDGSSPNFPGVSISPRSVAEVMHDSATTYPPAAQ